MHCTYNRDNYVFINKTNIKDGKSENFKKYSDDEIEEFGTEYDFYSLMHYGATYFSGNGLATIVPRERYYDDFNDVMGQRITPSNLDIYKLNKMYKCFDI